MPPRKSNVSLTSTTNEEGTAGGGTPVKERDGINIEDLSLPRTMVQRLAKGVLPPNTQIQKDAILALQKSATVFINYLANQANTTTQSTNRRTIPPTAICDALHELEFSDFVPRVEAELTRFNQIQTSKRNNYRRKLKEGKKEGNRSLTSMTGPGRPERGGGGEGGKEGERLAKRVRISEVGVDGEGVNGHAAATSASGGGGGSSPSAQLHSPTPPPPPPPQRPQRQRGFDPDEDPEEDEQEEEEDDDDDDDERSRANQARQEEEDEDEVDEDEDEDEDDADEYPDAGRRAESIEMDAHSPTESETRGHYEHFRRDGPEPYTSDEEDMDDDDD
ncbi:MAG: hypothetical protein Q9217_003800 [Psora testacea]